MKRMKLYVAGPMRGRQHFNFPAFDAACARLRSMGHIPIGPQELDRICGIDEFTFTDSDITREDMKNFMIRDLLMILTEADGICVLPGWELSIGSLAEVALARVLRLPVYDEFMNPIKIEIHVKELQHA